MIVLIRVNKEKQRLETQDEWRLGDATSVYAYGGVNEHTIIIASGRELDWIRDNITGIPMSKKNQIRWTGDIAAFIANSLPKPEEL